MSQKHLETYHALPKRVLLWKLFSSTFFLSAFTIGGGYVIVPLMRKTFVEKLGWIDEQEMIDIIAIAQSAPGVIAVNTSILVGFKVYHIAGALVTLLGTILPPLIILTSLSYVYTLIKDHPLMRTLFYGMSIGVAIVILDAVWSMTRTVLKKKHILPPLLLGLSFVGVFFLSIHIVIILVSCAIVGIVTFMIEGKKASKGNPL